MNITKVNCRKEVPIKKSVDPVSGEQEFVEQRKPEIEKPTEVIPGKPASTICEMNEQTSESDLPEAGSEDICGQKGKGVNTEAGSGVSAFKINAANTDRSCNFVWKVLCSHPGDDGE